MKITKVSMLSGVEHTMDLDVTQEQLDRWQSGHELIQNVMPHLTASEREFLMTGSMDNEWEDAFGEDEEDEE